MKQELIKKIITENYSVVEHSHCDVREYQIDDNVNYILYGIRRSGKSAIICKKARLLLEHGVSQNQIVFLDFSDDRMKDFTTEDFPVMIAAAKEIGGGKCYYFLDEVTRIPGWEQYVLQIANTSSVVYATGSDGDVTDPQIQNLLQDKFRFLQIYTYNFREYLLSKDIAFDAGAMADSKAKRVVEDAFSEYLQTGGFPYDGSFLRKREYLENIYQNDIVGDILGKNNIRNPIGFRLILRKMAEGLGTEISNSKLHSTVASSGAVLQREEFMRYIEYAMRGFMIFAIHNMSAIEEEKSDVPRYFFNDCGLLDMMGRNGEVAILKNLVGMMLMRRYGSDLKYFKNAKADVDFVVPGKSMAIHVEDSMLGQGRKKVILGLSQLAAAHPEITKFFIITKNEEGPLEGEGFSSKIMSALDFALGREALV